MLNAFCRENKQVLGLDAQPYIVVDFPAFVFFLKLWKCEKVNDLTYWKDDCITAIQFMKKLLYLWYLLTAYILGFCRHLGTISTKTPVTWRTFSDIATGHIIETVIYCLFIKWLQTYIQEIMRCPSSPARPNFFFCCDLMFILHLKSYLALHRHTLLRSLNYSKNMFFMTIKCTYRVRVVRSTLVLPCQYLKR